MNGPLDDKYHVCQCVSSTKIIDPWIYQIPLMFIVNFLYSRYTTEWLCHIILLPLIIRIYTIRMEEDVENMTKANQWVTNWSFWTLMMNTFGQTVVRKILTMFYIKFAIRNISHDWNYFYLFLKSTQQIYNKLPCVMSTFCLSFITLFKKQRNKPTK